MYETVQFGEFQIFFKYFYLFIYFKMRRSLLQVRAFQIHSIFTRLMHEIALLMGTVGMSQRVCFISKLLNVVMNIA